MSDADPRMTCWICGDPANTREHRTKASDLRSLFGIPTQADPIYFHTAKRKNFRVGSLKASVLKFTNRICIRCNSATTQPHDFAWQRFSEVLRARVPPIAPNTYIRPSRIFPYDSRRAMLNVHLYFLKVFGCQILEGNIRIDTAPFADAILKGQPHPNVYLTFGPAPSGLPLRLSGSSDVDVAMLDERCAFATWFYHVGNLWVNVMYAIDGERRDGLKHAWNPRFGSKRILMKDFLPDEPAPVAAAAPRS